MRDATDDIDWRGHLRSLAEVEPPQALWVRLQQARSARRARVRSGMAIAAAIALSALVVGLMPGTRPEDASMPAPVASTSAIDPAVRQLDLELSLAYERQADEREIAVLWQARERLISQSDAEAPAMLARL